MTIQRHIYDATTGNSIYAETANINYFLTTPLVPASVGSVTNVQVSVAPYTRLRYVGDPSPIGVSAQIRNILVDPGRRNGGATPGKPFILDDGVEKRSFTYTGSFLDLHSFLTGDIAMDLTVFSPSAAYELTATP